MCGGVTILHAFGRWIKPPHLGFDTKFVFWNIFRFFLFFINLPDLWLQNEIQESKWGSFSRYHSRLYYLSPSLFLVSYEPSGLATETKSRNRNDVLYANNYPPPSFSFVRERGEAWVKKCSFVRQHLHI